MNIEAYRKKQQQARALGPRMRLRCHRCLQPEFSCYCTYIRAFDHGIHFVILIHPIEISRRIATGRMAHLCLKNSQLLAGHNFSHHQLVTAIVNDPLRHCMILYPGNQSANLSLMSASGKSQLAPAGKILTIFVIDGTWTTARKMLNLSENLRHLPKICFTPDRPSQFRVRRQPRPECYSTIEAIHQTIDLLAPTMTEHHHLLELFDKMVQRQLELAHSLTPSPW